MTTGDLLMMRLARKQGCKACVFGVTYHDNTLMCQINPPRTSSANPWPVVQGNAFCGSWQAKDDEVLS